MKQNPLPISSTPHHRITSYPFHTSTKNPQLMTKKIPQLMTKHSPTRDVIAPPKLRPNGSFYTTRDKHVRRPVAKRFDQKYATATMKHPPSQMIWGAMSKNGTAGLYVLATGTIMNGPKYVELLKIRFCYI